ncbi:MAG: minor capsid protein [Culicoidibacterales bacterium]
MNLNPWLLQVEKTLNKLESTTESRLLAGFQLAQKALLEELTRVWKYNLNNLPDSASQRERIARDLLRGLANALNITPSDSQAILESMVMTSSTSGSRLANAILTRYQNQALETRVPLEAASAAAQNAYDRLLGHGDEFASKASSIIVKAVVSGSSIQKTSSELRQAIGGTANAAKRIVRTEVVEALEIGKLATYQNNNIELVQRLETLDNRICVYCAARHGNVYRIEEAPKSLHPNDRFAYVPFSFDWLEGETIDVEWLKASRATILTRLIGSPSRGAAPFEKANGVKPPKPVWVIPD